MAKTVMIALGADTIHSGHIDHIIKAYRLAGTSNTLMAVIQPDEALIQKKGYCELPVSHRFDVVSEMRHVDMVAVAIDKDGTVANTIRRYKPQILAKGGDRIGPGSMPANELQACKEVGCEIVYGVGDLLGSSSANFKNAVRQWARNRPAEFAELVKDVMGAKV